MLTELSPGMMMESLNTCGASHSRRHAACVWKLKNALHTQSARLIRQFQMASLLTSPQLRLTRLLPELRLHRMTDIVVARKFELAASLVLRVHALPVFPATHVGLLDL